MTDIDTSAEAVKTAVLIHRALGRSQTARIIEALAAERDALKAAKWDVRHTDTMNDMVMMGLARDSEAERAEKAETDRDRLAAERDALRAALRQIAAPLDLQDLPHINGIQWRRECARAALAQKEPGA
jgi:hypothetical protein